MPTTIGQIRAAIANLSDDTIFGILDYNGDVVNVPDLAEKLKVFQHPGEAPVAIVLASDKHDWAVEAPAEDEEEG